MGGQPGELPTAMAGTIFYHGQRLVKDPERGIFDQKQAEELVSAQASWSDQTGNPSLVHIYARTPQAFCRYMSFIDQIWDGPVIADSSQPTTRSCLAGLVTELGWADRVVYNSLSVATTQDEADLLAGSEVDSAILLAFNPAKSGVDGRIALLETGGPGLPRGLMELAASCGVSNSILDPGVPPLGSGAGEALRFTVAAKAAWGLPVCLGMHNAASSWIWLREKGRQIRQACDASTAALSVLAGCDLVLYGPMEQAESAFAAAAFADILAAEAVADLGIYPGTAHPRHRLI
ncbi:MAG: Tetrahydromethanopterin S-methyltransferase subunit H [Methanosaeta sp. PtaB.Bin039]|nr:MAG: Tetrahydromethanopterin S-methyltransferase subunit H [Methanosaeta sp. PtaB.Bin039]